MNIMYPSVDKSANESVILFLFLIDTSVVFLYIERRML